MAVDVGLDGVESHVWLGRNSAVAGGTRSNSLHTTPHLGAGLSYAAPVEAGIISLTRRSV